ncbi:hypothetical protein FGG08_004520 [Glutinoglossum americanum]|uniref:BTB domain-containing protein n=1 Tax=Glutinoglossum americanum TaxID=1670608 RepID=A0A9P8I927_9PEZI|nr:hypothetical protein FGG08_004520 [Glutinoglossum americanum]
MIWSRKVSRMAISSRMAIPDSTYDLSHHGATCVYPAIGVKWCSEREAVEIFQLEGPTETTRAGKAEELSYSVFGSTTLYAKIGGSERKYYFHKSLLIEECPYFVTLLSATPHSIRVTEGAIELKGKGCVDVAFDALADYMFYGTCECQEIGGRRGGRCILRANVYVLAERLCMGRLKWVSLGKMGTEFDRAVNDDGNDN